MKLFQDRSALNFNQLLIFAWKVALMVVLQCRLHGDKKDSLSMFMYPCYSYVANHWSCLFIDKSQFQIFQERKRTIN